MVVKNVKYFESLNSIKETLYLDEMSENHVLISVHIQDKQNVYYWWKINNKKNIFKKFIKWCKP